MGTEILRPRDCLPPPATSTAALFPRRNPNPKPYRKSSWASRPEPKKQRGGSLKPEKSAATSRLVAGQVTILRRGQHLDAFRVPDNVVYGIGRLRPDPEPEPELIPRQIRMEDRMPGEVYAGSGFSVSAPAPSALPLPNFFKRSDVAVDQTATRDLRRLLRLE
ncbi:hypothetical protein J5N97_017638 [Dioscorea zingiberensis]|uniref:Uncharacterized protein n=1 Tax=Dioscorea zingiberensis TaxID=325984 RepID=A0A9D5CLJ7_9LILI|nr:hypothetical protein J5N97_017638 [Dioscorea zingiberensis]